jgi:hypothetical protein
VFIAPGNEHNEAQFSLDPLRLGIKEFILKYSSPTSLAPKAPPAGKFVTVMSTHKGSAGEEFVNEFLHENEWHGRLIRVTNEDNEHINAMCASDYGYVYDG